MVAPTVLRKFAPLFLLVCAVALLVYAHHVYTSAPIDRIVVQKSARTLSTFRHGKKIKTYHVALGRNPIGPKEAEGDMKTPEGIYKIDNRKADSDYHLALHISYPSEADTARAAQWGVSAGCDIEIHGLPNGTESAGFHPTSDWTAGCIAVTNKQIEELYRVTPDGTVIEINP